MEEHFIALAAETMPKIEMISGSTGWLNVRLAELREELVAAGAHDIEVKVQVHASGAATAIVTWYLPSEADDQTEPVCECDESAPVDRGVLEHQAAPPVSAAAHAAAAGERSCYLLAYNPLADEVFGTGNVAEMDAYLAELSGTPAWEAIEIAVITAEDGGVTSEEDVLATIEELFAGGRSVEVVGRNEPVAETAARHRAAADAAAFAAEVADLGDYGVYRPHESAPVPTPLTEQVAPATSPEGETHPEGTRVRVAVQTEEPGVIDLTAAYEGLESVEYRTPAAPRQISHFTIADRIIAENFGATISFPDETSARRFAQVWAAVLGPDAGKEIAIVPVYKDAA